MAIHQINEVIVENYNTAREQPVPLPEETSSTIETPELSSSQDSAASNSSSTSSSSNGNVDTYA